MRLDGDNFPAIAADLDGALGELISASGRFPELWTRGRPGKWTAGQQVAHVGVVITLMADAFEAAEPALRARTLPPRPRRGALQSLFVSVVVARGHMPRGGKAGKASWPPERPERETTLAALTRDAGRLRALGERLSPDQRDRIWIWNPFINPTMSAGRAPTWHYCLTEAVRVHAVHARLHAKQIAEIAR